MVKAAPVRQVNGRCLIVLLLMCFLLGTAWLVAVLLEEEDEKAQASLEPSPPPGVVAASPPPGVVAASPPPSASGSR